MRCTYKAFGIEIQTSKKRISHILSETTILNARRKEWKNVFNLLLYKVKHLLFRSVFRQFFLGKACTYGHISKVIE